VDKSNLMFVGLDGAVPDPEEGLGFKIVDKVHILGFDITKNFIDLSENFDKVIEKITSLANFWNRYRLSLPGRIKVAKTLMLSQISYIGSLIQPTPQQLELIQTIINNFVKGNLRIAKNNIVTSLEKGGIGMIDVQEFLIGLQCSWFKRCYNSTIDSWRTDLNVLTQGNVLTANPDRIDEGPHPVLNSLSKSFWEFKKYFYRYPGNFTQGFVLGNPLLIDNRRDKNSLCHNFLIRILQNIDESCKLRICNLLNDNGMLLEVNALSDLLGYNITQQDFDRLSISVNDSMYLANKNILATDAVSISLENFITRFKKGSRPFRRAISQRRESKIRCRNLTSAKTFFRLINIELPDEITLKNLYIQWGNNLLTNKTREFVFKFRTNLLGLNTRVSHFNRNISRNCTFCSLSHINPAPDEEFLHLFFDCPCTRNVLENFFTNFLPELQMGNDIKKKKFFFYGMEPFK
jgi:hypothetical protein